MVKKEHLLKESVVEHYAHMKYKVAVSGAAETEQCNPGVLELAREMGKEIVRHSLGVIDHLTRSLNAPADDAVFAKNHFPLRERSRGKDLIDNPNQLFTILGPLVHRFEAGVVFQFRFANGTAKTRPERVGLQHGQPEPPVIFSTVAVHQGVAGLGTLTSARRQPGNG